MIARLILFLLFIAVPTIEITLFIVVGSVIGVVPTIVITFATAFAGAALAKRQGFDTLQRLKTALDENRMPGEEIGHAVTIVLAGMLLFTPGFFTDALGLLLFIPVVRRALWRWMKARFKPMIVTGEAMKPQPARPVDGPVVELGPEDFGEKHDDTPWRPGNQP